MTTRDNTPPPEDWSLPPRCCGVWSNGLACEVCGNWMPRVPPNIELGQE